MGMVEWLGWADTEGKGSRGDGELCVYEGLPS